ncbi:MAG: cystathionine gamma-lyase [Burkholderiaceae bacterium]|nr:cystathionine gamma-lyase [Burkholderiaceae bacterium]
MSDIDAIFARSLHHTSKSTGFGEAFAPPIVNTSVYRLEGDPGGQYQYARWGNPTWTALEDALAVLEDAETVTFPSGMAAIASVLYSALKSGDHVLLPSDGYYTVRLFAEKYLRSMGVIVDFCATVDVAEHALDGYKLVWLETPSNPGLDLADIASVAIRAKAVGALVVVDNTTMTPLGQRPLDLGADIVVSADTKALNGHSDVLFGHVSSRNPQLIGAVREWRKIAGAVPGPHEAWLVHRGLETLEVRYTRMCDSARAIAERLERHPKVATVRYPGLPSHPAHRLAQSQMASGGSLIALTLGDRASAERFIQACALMRESTSFGGVHTCAERRARWGDAVSEGFIRVSVGCEPTQVLLAEFERALEVA